MCYEIMDFVILWWHSEIPNNGNCFICLTAPRTTMQWKRWNQKADTWNELVLRKQTSIMSYEQICSSFVEIAASNVFIISILTVKRRGPAAQPADWWLQNAYAIHVCCGNLVIFLDNGCHFGCYKSQTADSQQCNSRFFYSDRIQQDHCIYGAMSYLLFIQKLEALTVSNILLDLFVFIRFL